MKREHKYEYDKHHSSIYLQAISSLIAILFLVSMESVVTDPANVGHILYDIYIFMFDSFDIPLFLQAVTLLYVKRPDDILQGLSKLDYYVKVSIF